MKKRFASGRGRLLPALFLFTMAAYAVIFASAFAELPIGIGPVHQLLLFYGHFIPMFLLELLLCRLARPLWRALVPALLTAVPAFLFVAACGFQTVAWALAGMWCAAPVLGSLLGWAAWRIRQRLKQKTP